MVSFFVKLAPYIMTIIHCLATLCAGVFVFSILSAHKINKKMSRANEKDYKETTYSWVSISYNIFIALVSLFPMLGMLGTVLALLSLDITTGITQELQQNFFLALDTTALGLIYSIVFKLLNSIFQSGVENAIEKNAEILKEKY